MGGYTTPNIRASAGDTYPAIYGEQYVKDDQGRILVDEDPASANYGLPMVGEFGKIGDVSPDFIMGLRNGFTIFKYVTLSAFMEWKNGGDIYSGSNRLMNLYGSSATTEDRETPFIYPGYLSNGTPNNIERGGVGDEDAYFQLYANTLSSLPEANIMDASYLQLSEVALTFKLPKNI
ncbi:MAG: hypothetical protein HC831_11870 [Chloroflexia bacterium]|nr:hypothetical protein [Chloroflexia bacterium]